MSWYEEAVFYHIYPLGLLGAPKQNAYGETEHRLRALRPWIEHIHHAGFTALYIGPLFQSVGHGYETTDYRQVDCRLGDNQDLKDLVGFCHGLGIRVILDGVFNHTGRDFFAFQDIRQNREQSAYLDWYCNVNFGGNNEYGDGFSYENWGGYNLMAKLNQKNPQVQQYICDTIRFWKQEFDIDGIRLDAADVLDFGFMQKLRETADGISPDFWLMGEVIHGDYSRWIREGHLHSVTNYQLHKAFYSAHNDHNYFEIAHTVRRLNEGSGYGAVGKTRLYQFVDNHDVDRIASKLRNRNHFLPVSILLYTLPGIPSVYYGSEFGLEGRKGRWSDDEIRPCLSLEELKRDPGRLGCLQTITRLGQIHREQPALSYGEYQELLLTTGQYAFARSYEGKRLLVMVNNENHEACFRIGTQDSNFHGALSGSSAAAENGLLQVMIPPNSGEIWIPVKTGEVPTIPAGRQEKSLPEGNSPDPEAEEPSSVRAGSAAEDPQPAIPDQGQVRTKAEINVRETDRKQTETAAPQETESPSAQKAAEDSSAFGQKATGDRQPDLQQETLTDRYAEGYAAGRIAGLQQAILAMMEKNGYVTDRMRQDVADNTNEGSLINWVKSFIRR